MILYASEAQLTAWMGVEPEVVVTPYLRKASGLVHTACINDLYDVDATGKPSDPDLAEAMQEAVCEQCELWIENGVNPVAGVGGVEAAVVKSSIDGASIELDPGALAASVAANAASVYRLSESAFAILRAAGLASAAVRGY